MDTPTAIGTDELYTALWTLVPTTATLAAIEEQPALLEIARDARQPHADNQALAVRAREAIITACCALDNPDLAVEPRWHGEGAAVLVLLGLATGYHAAPLHRRRDGAAGLLGYEVGTAFKTRAGVRSHAQNAVYAASDRLFQDHIEARAQAAPALVTEQRGEVAALTVELLKRYEAYYSMYTPLTALRADLIAALELAREGDDPINRYEDYVASSLHAYAEFLVAKRDFMERYQGVWIFAQADIEKAVADSIKFIEHFSGLRYREESILRLQRTEHGELQPFVQALEAEEGGQEALARWRQHIAACTCDLRNPAGNCRMHQLIAASEYYIAVLDADWYRMVPWHHGPPENLDAIDPGKLYRAAGIAP